MVRCLLRSVFYAAAYCHADDALLYEAPRPVWKTLLLHQSAKRGDDPRQGHRYEYRSRQFVEHPAQIERIALIALVVVNLTNRGLCDSSDRRFPRVSHVSVLP